MNVSEVVNMEYEARVLITQEQYCIIKEKYLKEYPNAIKILNENYYFDTPDLYLTDHQMVLRLRKINNESSELTLKIQRKEGCEEINHPLTSLEEKEMLESCHIPNDKILKMLLEEGIDISRITLITVLKTDRIEIPLDNYLFVIDKNEYRNKVDYNLEVESDSDFHAKSILKSIISEFDIEYKKDYISKSKRAIYNL